MNKLLYNIFEEVISKEKDIAEMNRRINECIMEYISRYNNTPLESDMEQ